MGLEFLRLRFQKVLSMYYKGVIAFGRKPELLFRPMYMNSHHFVSTIFGFHLTRRHVIITEQGL